MARPEQRRQSRDAMCRPRPHTTHLGIGHAVVQEQAGAADEEQGTQHLGGSRGAGQGEAEWEGGEVGRSEEGG